VNGPHVYCGGAPLAGHVCDKCCGNVPLSFEDVAQEADRVVFPRPVFRSSWKYEWEIIVPSSF